MTVEIQATWTKAGLNKLWHAKGQGLRDILTEIALGSVAFSPNADMTTFPGEEDTFHITDAQEGDLLMRLGVRATTDKQYPVRAAAGRLNDGTLLFTYSSPDPNFLITSMTEFVSGLDMRFALKLDMLPSNSLSVSVTDPGSMVYTSLFAKFGRAIMREIFRGLQRDKEIENLRNDLREVNNKLNLLGDS